MASKKGNSSFQTLDMHCYRATAFDVIGCEKSATFFVISRFVHKNARQESSSDLRNISSLEFKVREGISGHGPSFGSLEAVFANNAYSTASKSSNVGYACALTINRKNC